MKAIKKITDVKDLKGFCLTYESNTYAMSEKWMHASELKIGHSIIIPGFDTPNWHSFGGGIGPKISTTYHGKISEQFILLKLNSTREVFDLTKRSALTLNVIKINDNDIDWEAITEQDFWEYLAGKKLRITYKKAKVTEVTETFRRGVEEYSRTTKVEYIVRIVK